jgi:hypothetical protein
MALLYVAEFSSFAVDPNTGEAIAKVPPLAEYTVAMAGTSQAFGAATKFVRLNNDVTAPVQVEFGPAPTIVAGSMRLAANQTEYFGVNSGDKVAVAVAPA